MLHFFKQIAMSKQLFSTADQLKIVEAIKLAEKQTSGEVRVHIEPTCIIDPVERALQVFTELKMDATELKNGVLIYLATEDKKFAIIGDKGIHEKVQDSFWNEAKELMKVNFVKGDFTAGLTEAIGKVGEKLKLFFPFQSNDADELSNEISFGKDTNA